jgi:hypothetical protein
MPEKLEWKKERQFEKWCIEIEHPLGRARLIVDESVLDGTFIPSIQLSNNIHHTFHPSPACRTAEEAKMVVIHEFKQMLNKFAKFSKDIDKLL